MEFKIPWNDIFDLQEYLHFCCTKCDYKSQEGQEFRTHLDETHEEKLKDDLDWSLLCLNIRFISSEYIVTSDKSALCRYLSVTKRSL